MRTPSQDTLIKKFRVVIDTREQLPYKFKDSISKGLPSGDYTVEYEGKTYEDQIIIERKSNVSELFSATGSQRERWERELEKLVPIPFKWVVCEFDFLSIVNDQPPGILEASSVYGSIFGWQIAYKMPFFFAGNRVNGRAFVWKTFYEFTKKRILGMRCK